MLKINKMATQLFSTFKMIGKDGNIPDNNGATRTPFFFRHPVLLRPVDI